MQEYFQSLFLIYFVITAFNFASFILSRCSSNKTRKVRITLQWDTFVQPLLQWKSSITYSKCVFVPLGIQHAIHIVICGLSGSIILFHINGSNFWEGKKPLNVKCVPIFSTTVVRNIFHSKKNWAKYDQNVHWPSCKVPLYLSHFNETWIFSTNFRKKC